MKVSKMRIGVSGGTNKVVEMLKCVSGEMKTMHNFRQYLIKDGVLQNGCYIVREKLTAPKTAGTPITTEGYTVGYDEMLEKGELVHAEGALKVMVPKLNVGNTIMPMVMQNLFIYSEEGVGNEAYGSNKMYAEVAYYSEQSAGLYMPVEVEINNVSGIRPNTSVQFNLYSAPSVGTLFTQYDEERKYGMGIGFGVNERELHGTEILYIKDVYIIA